MAFRLLRTRPSTSIIYNSSTNYFLNEQFFARRVRSNNKIIELPFSTDNKGYICQGRRCTICPQFRINNYVTSTHTGYRIPTVKHIDCSCNSKNLIYLLTCNNCKIQYVGETKNKLKTRMSQHKSAIKNQKHETLMAKHFKNPNTACRDFTIEILDNIDSQDNKIRRDKELFWIRMLQTAFPMGLNDNIQGYGNISLNPNPFIQNKNPYSGFRISLRNRNHGKRNKNNFTNLSSEQIRQLFCNNKLSDICKILNRTKKSIINQVIDYIINVQEFKQLNQNIKQQMYASFFRYFFEKHLFKKERVSTHRLKIPFINKSLEFMNIKRVVNKPEVLNIIKETSDKNPLKTEIMFSYEEPISRSILNYNQFLKKLDATEIEKRLKEPCICDSSKYESFIEPKTGHIMQGNLEMLKNKRLQTIMEKGTKYRIQTIDDPDTIFETIKISLENHLTFIVRHYKLNQNQKSRIALIFRNWLENLRINPTKNPEYGKNEIIQDIKRIQKHFVIVLVDKASNNYSIICKKLYIKFLEKELDTN